MESNVHLRDVQQSEIQLICILLGDFESYILVFNLFQKEISSKLRSIIVPTIHLLGVVCKDK